MKGLVIIDMQNGFLKDNAPIFVPNGKSIVKKIKRAIEFCRKEKIQLIWTQIYIDDFRDTQYQSLFPDHFYKKTTVLSKGSDNYAIIKDLTVLIDETVDLIVEKNTYSAFIGSELDSILRKNKITDLYFAGVTTNVCVESSLRDAFQLGYNSYLIKDCTKTFNEDYQRLSEEIISFVFGHVITLTNFIDQ